MKKLHDTLEGALGVFYAMPEREFDSGHKLKGIFTHEIKQAGLNKAVIKKLVRKGLLMCGRVEFSKTGHKTFYALRPKVQKVDNGEEQA